MEEVCITNLIEWSVLTPAFISSIAAFFSAVAAWKSWGVAKSSLNFQRNTFLNKRRLQVVLDIIEKLIELKILTEKNPLSLPDKELKNLNSKVEYINELFLTLNEMQDIENTWQEFSEIKSMNDLLKTTQESQFFLTKQIENMRNLRNELI